jgi:hypothetical protein
MRKVYLQ